MTGRAYLLCPLCEQRWPLALQACSCHPHHCKDCDYPLMMTYGLPAPQQHPEALILGILAVVLILLAYAFVMVYDLPFI